MQNFSSQNISFCKSKYIVLQPIYYAVGFAVWRKSINFVVKKENSIQEMTKQIIASLAAALVALLPATHANAAANDCNKSAKPVTLRIVETTDVHGCFFPYDFINKRAAGGSLARVSHYVDSLRAIYGDRLLLIDTGDMLQGQPVANYYNYVRTDTENIASLVSNYLHYDVRCMGNHDIETGHPVYDKWVKEMTSPMVCANVTNTATGQPYWQPYVILKRGGLKIAVIGITTPGVPSWLSESLWSGMHFEDAVSSARKWLDIVKKKEKPDVVIGLFHTGINDKSRTNGYVNDATLEVACTIPGYDIIFYGHDHSLHCEQVANGDGTSTYIVNPANKAMRVADAEIVVDNGTKKISVSNVDVSRIPVDRKYMDTFAPQINEVKAYVDTRLGSFTAPMSSRDCYFGESTLGDFIHDVMLTASGAELSFASPLLYDATVAQGDVTLSDMYKLYSYENDLCVLNLTGAEIHRYLEYSYDGWINTMTSADSPFINLQSRDLSVGKVYALGKVFFNLDTAAGIDYVVDATKPAGQRVTIKCMTGGAPFDENRTYRVAVNSYRAAGGGGLLTQGAGIAKDQLEKRQVWRGDHQLRDYVIDYVRTHSPITPKTFGNWQFVPTEWTTPAAARDRKLLFPDEAK